VGCYEDPLEYNLTTDDTDRICYLVATGLTFIFLVVIYNGWIVEDSGTQAAASRTPKLLYNLMAWVTMFAWWDPFDSTFNMAFEGDGVMSARVHSGTSFLFSVFIALSITGLSALLTVMASFILPQDELRIIDWLLTIWPPWFTCRRTGNTPSSSIGDGKDKGRKISGSRSSSSDGASTNSQIQEISEEEEPLLRFGAKRKADV